MPDPIYFNGVDGDSGDYGLKLDSEEDWYAQLTGHGYDETSAERNAREARERQEREARERLEKDVARQAAKRAEALVTVLASLLAEALREDAAPGEELWLQLAEGVVRALLGDAYATPEHIAVVQARLQQRTAERLTEIVRMLLGSGVQLDAHDLVALLLDPEDEAPDNSLMLKEKLKQRANDILTRLAKSPGELSTKRGKALDEATPDERRQWVAALVSDLRQLPVPALQSLGRATGVIAEDSLRDLLSRPRKVLLEHLDKGHIPDLQVVNQKIDALPEDAWDELLDTFVDAFSALADAETPVWQQGFTAVKQWSETLRNTISHLGVVEGVDPADLSQTGWGIIFPAAAGSQQLAEIKAQLKPLLDLRKQQAQDLYREYTGADGYRLQDTAAKFVSRQKGDVTKPVDPLAVPYYLLIVGGPDEIPFHFQYQLDIQYAVGRIHFDTLEDYGRYARAVVDTEKGRIPQEPKAAFFGVTNPGDPATTKSTEYLKAPLLKHLRQALEQQWQFQDVDPKQTGKTELARFIGGDRTPAFLFTSSHGMEFKASDPEKQRQRQGALLCNAWRGERKPIPEDWYFSGSDVPQDADLKGMIAFLFACYGAGTPRFDEFSKQAFKTDREVITPEPFIAALPKAMLAHRALAVIGHVERAWGSSYLDESKTSQITVFRAFIERLLKGYPVGWAMEYVNIHYAALSAELTLAMEADEGGGRPGYPPRPTAHDLARMWTANNDARGYIVIGDPAVRLVAVKPSTASTFMIQGESEW